MKYFMDTHDRAKGSWPSEDISEAEFIRVYAEFGQAVAEQGGHDLGAHVNVQACRAFCFTCGPDEEAVAPPLQDRNRNLSTFGWCLATCLGVAVVIGVGKALVDLRNSGTGPPRRRQPWELD